MQLDRLNLSDSERKRQMPRNPKKIVQTTEFLQISSSELEKETTKQDETSVTAKEPQSANELAWHQLLVALDTWHEEITHMEKNILASASRFCARNTTMRDAYANYVMQLQKDINHWKQLIREEWISLLAGTQYFVPQVSLKDVNESVQRSERKMMRTVTIPILEYTRWTNRKSDEWMQELENYMKNRRKLRSHFVSTMKNSMKVYEQGYLGLEKWFSSKFTSLFFPVNRYLDQDGQENRLNQNE